ncbi:hypothetical protein LT330_007100 [Penicillium expansum]|nr:hypothetical protein N7453_002128 [Penicillium expansum]KAK4868378.1 hypothetical protein LT330_007100 [Penicillium expansum]
MAIGALNFIAISSIFTTLLVKYKASPGPDFQFYKNTRFKECAAVVPDANNCTAITTFWNGEGNHYISKTNYGGNGNPSYEWCQIASCFNDYKVIPSSPNDSAMGLTALYSWLNIIMASIGAVKVIWKSSPWFKRHRNPKPCRGLRELSVIDWLVFIWEVCGPIVGWWVSFAKLITNPVPKVTISLIAWTTAWRYSSQVRLHPYSCALGRSPGIKRVLPWVFALIAALQWGATVYALQAQGNRAVYDSYTCLATQVASAPGTSTCSAEELCSKSSLFSTKSFLLPGDIAQGFPFGYFVLCSGCVFLPPFIAFVNKCHDSKNSFIEYYHRFSPVLCLALVAGCAMAATGLMYPITLGQYWNQRHPDALIAIDTDCHAVHVALSPWRFYLDVHQYARGLRAARLWFSV